MEGESDVHIDVHGDQKIREQQLTNFVDYLFLWHRLLAESVAGI